MPQPIDFGTELGRMSAVERIQQVNDRLSLNAQQRSTTEVQEQVVASETQVHETQAQSEKVETEQRRRNPYAGRRRKRQEKEAAESPAERSAPSNEEHQLDITI